MLAAVLGVDALAVAVGCSLAALTGACHTGTTAYTSVSAATAMLSVHLCIDALAVAVGCSLAALALTI
jgi:hypothetical protein